MFAVSSDSTKYNAFLLAAIESFLPLAFLSRFVHLIYIAVVSSSCEYSSVYVRSSSLFALFTIVSCCFFL